MFESFEALVLSHSETTETSVPLMFEHFRSEMGNEGLVFASLKTFQSGFYESYPLKIFFVADDRRLAPNKVPPIAPGLQRRKPVRLTKFKIMNRKLFEIYRQQVECQSHPKSLCSFLVSHSHLVRPCMRPNRSDRRSAEAAQTRHQVVLGMVGFQSDTDCRPDQARRRRRLDTEASEVEQSYPKRLVR